MTQIILTLLLFLAGAFAGSYLQHSKSIPHWDLAQEIRFWKGLLGI